MRRFIGVSVSLCLCCFFLFLFVGVIGIGAAEKSDLKGKITDIEGKAVEGVKVFLYDSRDVRRPADFISAGTGSDGLFHVVAPSGKYWVVARMKKAEGYGPLMPGDKHSGEPLEIELGPGAKVSMDFVVADLKEAAGKRVKEKGGSVKITGRIVDEKGSPVIRAYAIANRNERTSEIPDYISAWADNEGRYTMYVPRGRYYVGAALTFPPGQDHLMSGEMVVDSDRSDVVIVRKSHDSK
ncbi:MAG TPA: hypothetical protein VN328_00125 [Thermodesulfovibrionales bacterium]|nr:hypothetical protein [Thermodesulfovibrionales bacterium]